MEKLRKSTFAKLNERKSDSIPAPRESTPERHPISGDVTSFEVFVEDCGLYQFDLFAKKSVFARYSIKKGCLYKGFKKIGKIKFIRVKI